MYAHQVFSRMAPTTLASLIADCATLQEWDAEDVHVIRLALRQLDATCGMDHGRKLLAGYGISLADLPAYQLVG